MIDRKISTAVVTGPTGAIGTALCRELANRGIVVYAVCRPGSPRASVIPSHENIRKIFCDVASLNNLPQLIHGGVDVFFHLAWAHTIGSGRNDMLAQVENVRNTIEAVRVAATLGCKIFIGAGSQAEYGRVEGVLKPDTPCFPENGYGMAKLCAGQMSRVECRKLGIDHVWTRILSVYGPGDSSSTMVSSVIRQLLNHDKPALTAGIQLWDYLYSEDAARAFYLIAQHGIGGKTYVLGSGSAKPLRCYVEQLRDAIDPSLPLGVGEIPYSPMQVMHLEADISALNADTGFQPRIDFADGIKVTVERYKEEERWKEK